MNIAKILFTALVFVLLSGCDSSSDGVVDPGIVRPTLSRVTVSPASINTDTVFVHGTKNPDDQLALSFRVNADVSAPGITVQSLRYTITRLMDGSVAESGNLPLTWMEQIRIKATPSPFATTISRDVVLNVVRSDVGQYSVEISAVENSGLESNGFWIPVAVKRLNKPPVISNLQAPTTVSLPQVGAIAIPISLTVSDSNGLFDILTVQFTSYLPSGQASSSGPIRMFDDGSLVDLGGYSSGDAVAGDGNYTLNVQLPAGALTGIYTFRYVAIDKSRDSSNVITQTLTVQ